MVKLLLPAEAVALTCHEPEDSPSWAAVQSQVAAPLLSACLELNFITVDPLVKLMEHMAPMVVLHTDSSESVDEAGLWLLTKLPEGAVTSLGPVEVSDPPWGLAAF